MKEVSIVLVSYNTAQLTLDCIESIYAHTKGVDFEVVVVDNDSTDGSAERVRTKFPEAIVVRAGENLGFGRANNLGVEHSRGTHLLFLNTDTLLRNNAVKVLYDYYTVHPDVGAIGGVLLSPDDSIGWSGGRFNTLGRILWWYYGRLFDKKRRNANIAIGAELPLCVDYVTGADLFVSRAVFDKAEGFDKNIFLYYEDELLGWNIKKMGLENRIIDGVQIVHFEGASMAKKGGTVPNQKRIISERSMFYYFKKTQGPVYKSWAKLVYFVLVALPLRLGYTFSENKEYLCRYIRF